MTQTVDERIAAIKAQRLIKAQHHLSQYAPIWLIDEKLILEEDAIQFNVVFFHPSYNWVSRRYRYDAFTDTLYQKGQISLDEDEALAIQNQAPFISASTLNTINSYGG